LLLDTGAVLLDAAPNRALEQEIRGAIEDGDARIADLHVWRVGPGKYATIVSLVAESPLTPSDYARRLRVHDELVHITIEAPARARGG
jgi:Co/Zn/Cd efflux system component